MSAAETEPAAPALGHGRVKRLSPVAEVAIVCGWLPHYRVEFFERLRTELRADGIALRLLVGQPDPEVAKRNDAAKISWAEPVPNLYLGVGTHRAVWQPVLRTLRSSDLVIATQASRYLVNYPLVAWRRVGGPKLAWWGHGRNLDGDAASRTGEAVKRRLAAQADWWFCYTEGTARIVEGFGVPPECTTVVQNAVDTTGLAAARQALPEAEVEALRRDLGIGAGPVAVTIGSIYSRKRPGFLVQAADELRVALPGFELIVIGDGPDRPTLEASTSSRPWLHVVGRKTGTDLVRYASPASVALNPGLVGLAVLDAFALGLPMITCDLPYHSPEIYYLEHSVNGLVLGRSASPSQFASATAELLGDPARLERLARGARVAATCYTLEEMVRRFAHGVRAALGLAEPERPEWSRPRPPRLRR